MNLGFRGLTEGQLRERLRSPVRSMDFAKGKRKYWEEPHVEVYPEVTGSMVDQVQTVLLKMVV